MLFGSQGHAMLPCIILRSVIMTVMMICLTLPSLN